MNGEDPWDEYLFKTPQIPQLHHRCNAAHDASATVPGHLYRGSTCQSCHQAGDRGQGGGSTPLHTQVPWQPEPSLKLAVFEHPIPPKLRWKNSLLWLCITYQPSTGLQGVHGWGEEEMEPNGEQVPAAAHKHPSPVSPVPSSTGASRPGAVSGSKH